MLITISGLLIGTVLGFLWRLLNSRRMLMQRFHAITLHHHIKGKPSQKARRACQIGKLEAVSKTKTGKTAKEERRRKQKFAILPQCSKETVQRTKWGTRAHTQLRGLGIWQKNGRYHVLPGKETHNMKV